MIGARNDSAFNPKHQFSPNFASASPPSAGPIVTRQVELDGIQRDGVGHVFAFTSVGISAE